MVWEKGVFTGPNIQRLVYLSVRQPYLKEKDYFIMNRENQKLSTRAIAKGLMTDLVKTDGEVNLEEFLLWPPDLFALTSKILSITGAYTNVIAPLNNKYWPPVEIPVVKYEGKELNWVELMQFTGQQWRSNLERLPPPEFSFEKYFSYIRNIQDNDKKANEIKRIFDENIIPEALQIYWNQFILKLEPELKGNVDDLVCIFDSPCPNSPEVCKAGTNVCCNCDLWKTFEALMSLHAIADEACSGWGLRTPKTVVLKYTREQTLSKAQEFAEKLLVTYGTLSTINNTRGRVLPKRHTPHIGITLRSLSANLAFHNSSIDVNWRVKFNSKNSFIDKFSKPNHDNDYLKAQRSNDHDMSILLFPWPFEISAKDFTTVHNPNINLENKKLGFFTYRPAEKELNRSNLIKNLEDAIASAKKESPEIDLIILPECSLGNDELVVFENVLKSAKISSYIVGKREETEESDFVENIVSFNMASKKNNEYHYDHSQKIEQNKHHRWKLDEAQIIKYNLGGVLSPNRNWWEGINIKKRKVNFINIGEEITLCPLICEDLARQDPIADLIRTVGPSLVVTILMDGPQKKERWSAKYASVLSEDPGCTVITLTSLGMIKRNIKYQDKQSSSIAIISDCKGKAIEIDLEEGSKGILVNLCLRPEFDSLADGRIEYGYTNNLIVGAIHQLK